MYPKKIYTIKQIYHQIKFLTEKIRLSKNIVEKYMYLNIYYNMLEKLELLNDYPYFKQKIELLNDYPYFKEKIEFI